MEKMINAWRTLAPNKSFGGMTLAQFEAAAEPSRAARRKIEEIDAQRAEIVVERDTSDEAFEAKAKFVVAGVRADPTEGPDSALYAAFGYTRDSEHKSGLTRKTTKQTPAT
jgi:histidinol-phosphate/aromatic aminotransferase/cobyric acid decarboxylase-like protein